MYLRPKRKLKRSHHFFRSNTMDFCCLCKPRYFAQLILMWLQLVSVICRLRRTVNKRIMATEIEAWTTGPQNDGTNIKPLVVLKTAH